MLGIERAVKSTAATIDLAPTLENDDFTEVCQHNLASVKTTNLKTRLSKASKFVDYAPNVFEHIRQHYGIRAHQYIKSLGVENMLNSLLMSDFTWA